MNDYRFEKTNNADYLPEYCQCENCGDFVDNEHIAETDSGMLCCKCETKEYELKEWFKCDPDYLNDGGMSL